MAHKHPAYGLSSSLITRNLREGIKTLRKIGARLKNRHVLTKSAKAVKMRGKSYLRPLKLHDDLALRDYRGEKNNSASDLSQILNLRVVCPAFRCLNTQMEKNNIFMTEATP